MNKTLHAILSILDKYPTVVGSRELSRQLKLHGVELTERTVRYYLKMLDKRGHTEVFGKEGRKITARGREELKHSLVSDKIGFVISRIETLSYLTTLDMAAMEGDVILNISYFPRKHLRKALKLLKPVFASPYVMSDRVILADGRGADRRRPRPQRHGGAGHDLQRDDQRDISEGRHPRRIAVRRSRGDRERQTPAVRFPDQL